MPPVPKYIVTTFTDGKIGVAQELVSYLNSRNLPVLFMAHPMPVRPDGRTACVEYRDGRQISSAMLGRNRRGAIGRYLQAAWLTFAAVWRNRRQAARFVGHANLDCLMALIAGAGTAIPVVYCSIDFTTHRFGTPLLDWLFRVIDRLVYRYADAVWHSYPDFKTLKPYAWRSNCHATLHGNNFRRIPRLPWDQRRRHGMVFLGGVSTVPHLEAVMQAMVRLQGEFPDITLDVIGESWSPTYMGELKEYAIKLNVAERVTWHGLIEDSRTFENIMAGLGVGLSLYGIEEGHPSWYQIAGKIYTYAACGLVTMILDCTGPVSVREVRANNIGLVISLPDLTEEIAGLFRDQAQYRQMADNAVRWASRFDWQDKFDTYISLLEQHCLAKYGGMTRGNP